MDEKTLENIYQEKLEERLIEHIAEKHHLDFQIAMNVYYSSKMAERIHEGTYGIQYLDYKVLVEMIENTEPELFREL